MNTKEIEWDCYNELWKFEWSLCVYNGRIQNQLTADTV